MACAGAGLFVLVRYLETTAVFFPSKQINLTPDRMGLSFEDLYLTTADGVKINAWFLKNSKASSTIIFAHGNAGAMGDRLIKVKYFFDLGLKVLIFDYRGFGLSEGNPTEKGVYLDGQAAFDYLRTRVDVDQRKIIGYGSSMGGAVMADAAMHRPLALLIIDSSFSSARDVAKRFYPYVPASLMRIKFDTISKVKQIKIPKLFIHSPADRTIPFEMGRALFEAACEPKEFIQSTGGHNEVQIASDHATSAALKQYLISKGLL